MAPSFSKGITPVISIILLLLITIAMMGFAALFFQRSAQTATESGEQQLSQQTAALGENFEIININENNVTIRNKGTSALSNLAFFVDSNPVQASGTPIPRDGIGVFTLDNGKLAQYPGRELKVTSPGYSAKLDANFYGKNTVAYYTFDSTDGRAIKDDSGNGNDGTFSGETWNDGTISGATDATGKYGNALSFDGNDYIETTSSLSLANDEFTIELWVNPSSIAAYPLTSIGGGYPFFGISYETWAGVTGPVIRLDIVGCDAYRLINLPITAGEWSHLAVTYSKAAGIIRAYSDGAEFDTETANCDVTSGGSLAIGKQGGWNYFNGVIDEVRVYNRALTQGEIQENMNSAYPVNRTVASYSFEKIVGNSAWDTHNVVKGKYGAALSFDGVDDYVQTPVIPSELINTDETTMEAWIYPSTVSGEQVLTGRGTAFGVTMEIWNNNLAALINSASVTSSTPLAAKSWQHTAIAFKNSASTLRFYINGALVSTQTASNSKSDTRFVVSSPTSYHFNGIIDEVRILNAAIS